MKKRQGFYQTHKRIPFKKCQFCGFLKSMLLLSRKVCILTRTSPRTFSRCILLKTKSWQNLKILAKTRLTPVTDVFLVQEGLSFYIKRQKWYFHDLLHGDTGGYRRSQVVREDYKGLQEVSRGYRRLQGVTVGNERGLQGLARENRGLQGVTRDYRVWKKNLLLTKTSPGTFSWSIWDKNKYSFSGYFA